MTHPTGGEPDRPAPLSGGREPADGETTALDRPADHPVGGNRIARWWRGVGGFRGLAARSAEFAHWVYRNRRRIAAGIRRGGEILIVSLKTAARIGAVLVRMGEALGKASAPPSGGSPRAARGRRALAAAGSGMAKLGRRLDRTGRAMLPVAAGVEDIGEHLEKLSDAPLPPPSPDPPPPAPEPPAAEPRSATPRAAPVERSRPSRRAPRSSADDESGRTTRTPKAPAKGRRRAASEPERAPSADAPPATSTEEPGDPAPAAPADRTGGPPPAKPAKRGGSAKPEARPSPESPSPPPAGAAAPDSDGLPEALRTKIAALGSRPRKAATRRLIEAICRTRGWTTGPELAAWMGFGQKSLMRRHVTPMVREGRLVRRFPDRPNHPDQAYTLPE